MLHPRSSITSVCLVFSGVEIVLGRGESLIGRSRECAIHLDDPLMSRKHAVVSVAADTVTIRDLGSRNGVLVNGDSIPDSRTLAENDLITVGSHALLLREIRRSQVTPPAFGEFAVVPSSAHLARIELIRQPSLPTASISFPTSTTAGSGNRPMVKPLGAYRLIGEAAQRAFAAGKVERGVKILETPLLELLAALRAGSKADGPIVELSVELGLSTLAATHDDKWADFVRDVYAALRLSVPPSIAACIALAREIR